MPPKVHPMHLREEAARPKTSAAVNPKYIPSRNDSRKSLFNGVKSRGKRIVTIAIANTILATVTGSSLPRTFWISLPNGTSRKVCVTFYIIPRGIQYSIRMTSQPPSEPSMFHNYCMFKISIIRSRWDYYLPDVRIELHSYS